MLASGRRPFYTFSRRKQRRHPLSTRSWLQGVLWSGTSFQLAYIPGPSHQDLLAGAAGASVPRTDKVPLRGKLLYSQPPEGSSQEAHPGTGRRKTQPCKGRKPQKGPSPLAFLLLFPTSGHPPSIPDGIPPLGSGAQSYLPGYGAGHTQTPPPFRTSSRQGLPCGVGTLTGTGQPRGQGCLSAPRMKGLEVLTRPRRPMDWDCLL